MTELVTPPLTGLIQTDEGLDLTVTATTATNPTERRRRSFVTPVVVVTAAAAIPGTASGTPRFGASLGTDRVTAPLGTFLLFRAALLVLALGFALGEARERGNVTDMRSSDTQEHAEGSAQQPATWAGSETAEGIKAGCVHGQALASHVRCRAQVASTRAG